MLGKVIKFSVSSLQPVKEAITKKITESFKPVFLSVENESHMHSVPKGSETHFKLTIVADTFEGNSKVERHQKVYATLKNEFSSGLHALSMTTKSPREWENDSSISASPGCMGGSKHQK